MEWSQTYPGLPSMVPVARVFVRAMLNGSPRSADAELVAAELAANSLRHTPSGGDGGTFTICVSVRAGWARVAVTDSGAGGWSPTRHSPPADDDEYGRGLLILDQYADKYGHDVDEADQTVWAEFLWSES